MAAPFPSSLCPAFQSQVSFKKHEQALLHHELFNVLCKSLAQCKGVFTMWCHNWWWTGKQLAPQVSWSMGHLRCPTRYQLASGHSCLNWADLRGLENSQTSKSRCPVAKSPVFSTSAPQRLVFSALCELLKWFENWILRSQSFLERILSWDRAAFISTTASCCFRLICKVKQAFIAVSVPPFSSSFQEKTWKTEMCSL